MKLSEATASGTARPHSFADSADTTAASPAGAGSATGGTVAASPAGAGGFASGKAAAASTARAQGARLVGQSQHRPQVQEAHREVQRRRSLEVQRRLEAGVCATRLVGRHCSGKPKDFCDEQPRSGSRHPPKQAVLRSFNLKK